MKLLRANPIQGYRYRTLLLLLIGMICGVMIANLISRGYWFIAAAPLFTLPLVYIVCVHPFSGVILWLLFMPFVSVAPYPNLGVWAIYRILPSALLCLVIIYRIIKARDYPPVRLGPPELAMGILALLVTTSILLFQTDPNRSLIRLADRMILPFCMYMVVRLTAPREKEFIQLQWLALFIAFSQSIIGYLSWYAPGVLPETWHYLQGARTTGSLKDPDLYASVLIFCAAFLIHGAVNYGSRLVRTILFLAAGLCFGFVFLSLERAAWLGAFFVIIGLVILYPKTMIHLIIIGAIVLSILGTGAFASHIALSVERFRATDPIYDRIVVFDAMFEMFRMKPVWGWGYETLDENIQTFYRRVGEATITRGLVTSHNTYLTVLTELGLVGFILYIFPVIWWLALSIRAWKRMPKEGYWSRSLLAVLWLVMLFQFTVSNFMDMRWSEIGLVLWWLTLGLIANLVYPYLKIMNNGSSAQSIEVNA